VRRHTTTSFFPISNPATRSRTTYITRLRTLTAQHNAGAWSHPEGALDGRQTHALKRQQSGDPSTPHRALLRAQPHQSLNDVAA